MKSAPKLGRKPLTTLKLSALFAVSYRTHISINSSFSYSARSNSRWYHWRLVGSSVGPDPGCFDYVYRSAHAYGCVGSDTKWLDYLLRLVLILLRCWGRRRVSNDGHIWDGECRWFWKSFHQGRPSSSWSESHFRVLDARVGTIRQPGHFDSSTSDIPPWKWQSAILKSRCSVDIPHFFCYPGRWNSLARLLPLL